MRAILFYSTLALLLLAACFGNSTTGPSAASSHGWVVGEQSAGGPTILHTTDGYNWEMQGDSLPTLSADLVSVSAVDDSTAWAAGGISDGYGVILRTTDGGQTWQRLGSQSQVPNATLCVAALSKDVAWVGGNSNSILRTLDGGQTWDELSDPSYNSDFWQGVYAFGTSEAWFCGGNQNEGRIIHTEDGGTTWTSCADSLIQDLTMITMAAWDHDNVWVVGHGFTIVKSTDGGDTWENMTPDSMQGTENDANGLTLLSADDAWVVLDYGNIWKTSDGGENWTFQTLPPEAQGFFYLRISAQNSETAWAAGRSPYGTPEGVIIYTDDGGSNWFRIDDGSFPGLWGISFVDDLPN